MRMFREMRRYKQQLTDTEAREVLANGRWGTLAVLGHEGYPYTVPLNYTYYNSCIYFHCAVNGHKLDAIDACDKVSFCVVDKDEVVPEKYTSYYRSVVVFGRATIVDDMEEKMAALCHLGNRYNLNQPESLEKETSSGFARLHMVRIDIEHITGKQARELAKQSSEG